MSPKRHEMIPLYLHMHNVWSLKSNERVRGPDSYTLPLSGKPKQQSRFTVHSGVLASISSRRPSTISGRILPEWTEFWPAVCSSTDSLCLDLLGPLWLHLWQLKAKDIKVKWNSSPQQVISELMGVTCHMGSHSVTCHPTQVNTPCHNPDQIYLPQRDERLSWPRWLLTYRDGLPGPRWSTIQVLTRQCTASRRNSQPVDHKSDARDCFTKTRHQFTKASDWLTKTTDWFTKVRNWFSKAR